MPRTATIKPRRGVVRGVPCWVVRVPVDLRGRNGVERKFFRHQSDAGAFARELQAARTNISGQFHRLSAEGQSAILRSLERVGGDPSRIEAAVDAWLRSQPIGGETATVGHVMSECLEAKGSANLRARYLVQLRSSFRIFAAGRNEKPIREITADEVARWVNGHGWRPKTRRGHLCAVRTLFSFALKRGYVTANPALGVDMPANEDAPPGILTVEETERLLRAATEHDPGLIPYLTLGLFAGLRATEARQLTWADLGTEYVSISAAKAKTRTRRLVTIHPTLRSWLDLGGDLPPRNLVRRLRRIRKLAAIPWPSNCLRHSFASYHLAAFQSADRTAHEMGHGSTQLLYAHYRELVTKEAGLEFFNLRAS